MIKGYTDFEFDLPGALLARLVDAFSSLDSAPLVQKYTDAVPAEAQGVYQIFLNNELVYIGKTDAKAGLGKRLHRHGRKIQHRKGLDPILVTFKAVRVYVFTAVDLESQLIATYGGKSTVTWNGSGFGSNDPGQQRDTTTYKATHFDVMFPIDIDLPLDLDLHTSETVADLFSVLKAHLPYTFRYELSGGRGRGPHPDLKAATISIGSVQPLTARRIIENAVSSLPAGWQAVQLPSILIMYKNDKIFSQGVVIARSQ